MAGRVNTRFVLILSAVIVVLAGGVGGIAYYQSLTPIEENIARGDRNYEQGDYAAAAEQYGKALTKKSGNPDLMLKYADAVWRIEVEDVRTARQHLQQTLENFNKVLELDPDNTVAMERLFALQLRMAEELGVPVWEQVLKQTNEILERQPNEMVARKYRGIAQVNRMRATPEMDIADRDRAREDLTLAHTAEPDDQDVVYHLALYGLIESRTINKIGRDSRKAADLLVETRQLVNDAVRANPKDPQRQVNLVRVLTLLEDRDAAQKALADLEAAVAADPSSTRVVLETAEMVARLEPNAEGAKRAEELIRKGQEARSNDPRLTVMLATMLAQGSDKERGLQMLRDASSMKFKGNPLEVLASSNVANMASLRYADIQLQTAMRENDQDKRTKLLDEVADTTRRLNAEMPDVAPLNAIEGRLALARGDASEAVKKLARASTQFNDQNPDVLVYLAQACERDRQTGEAAKQIRKLLALRPDVPAIKAELARIQLINGQTDKEALAESAKLLSEVLKEDPANEAALRLHAGHLVMSGKKEEALKVFRQLEPDKRPDVAVNMARLYADMNQKAVGRELVEPYFQKDPKNLQLLQEMLRLAESREQGLAYIKASRDAGSDSPMLDLWEAQASGDAAKARATLTEMVTGDDVKDPIVRHLNRFALLRQEGKIEESNRELEAAAKINPDHARLVDTRFELALQDQDWDRAESLAARAGRLGLDEAEGRFYFGRLELARGRLGEAISSFTQGTQVRPVYAEGHRLRAEALRANNDHAAALAEYRVALEQQPGNVDVMRGMAVSLAGLDRAAEALPMMRRAYEAAPNNATVVNQYLAMEQQIGDPQRALELRQKLAERNPKDLANRRAIAVLLARLNRPDEAIKAADALVAENPGDLDSIGTAAGVRAVMGRKDEGRKLLQDYVNNRGDKATTNDWVLFARYLLSVQDVGAATAAYGQAIVLEDPKARPATRELADNLFGMREYKQAAEHYQKLYNSDPKDKRIGQRFIETLLRDGQLDRAEKVLAEHRAAAGDDGAIALLEAMLWTQRNLPDKALAAVNRGIEKEPTRALLYLERARLQESDPTKADAVFADLKRAVELDDNLAVARLGLAGAYARRKENAEAVRVLQKLLETAPHIGQARLMLIDLHLAAGQDDRARASVEEAQRLFPRDPAWPRVAARLAMKEKKPDAAEKNLRQALGLSGAPQDFVTLVDFLLVNKRADDAVKLLDEQPQLLEQSPLLQAMRGRALAAGKKAEQANAAFVKAIGMAHDFGALQAVAVHMEQALGREAAAAMLEQHATGERRVPGQVLVAQLEAAGGKREEAISRLQRMESAVPDADRLLYDRVLSGMLHQKGDYAGAAAVYKRMADNNPKDLGAFNNLAYLLAENLNRPAEALPYAEKAAALAPNDPQVLDTLGWVQFKSGKTEDAYNNLRRSVDAQVFAANSYHLAEVLLAREEREGARQMFESAKRLAEQSKDQSIRDASDKRLRELGL